MALELPDERLGFALDADGVPCPLAALLAAPPAPIPPDQPMERRSVPRPAAARAHEGGSRLGSGDLLALLARAEPPAEPQRVYLACGA